MKKQKKFTLIELIVIIAIVGFLLKLTLPAFSKLALGSGTARAANTFAGKMKYARMLALQKRSKVAVVMLTHKVMGKGENSMIAGRTGSTKSEKWHCGSNEISKAYRVGIVHPNGPAYIASLTKGADGIAPTTDYIIYSWAGKWEFTPGTIGFDQGDLSGTKDVDIINDTRETFETDGEKYTTKFLQAAAFIFDKNGVLEEETAGTGHSITFSEGMYDLVSKTVEDGFDQPETTFVKMNSSNWCKVEFDKYSAKETITP